MTVRSGQRKRSPFAPLQRAGNRQIDVDRVMVVTHLPTALYDGELVVGRLVVDAAEGSIGVVFALMRVLVVLSECISPAAIRPVAPVQRAQFPASGGTLRTSSLSFCSATSHPVMARSSTRGQDESQREGIDVGAHRRFNRLIPICSSRSPGAGVRRLPAGKVSHWCEHVSFLLEIPGGGPASQLQPSTIGFTLRHLWLRPE